MSQSIIYDKMPVITLRGIVVYPGSKMNFDIARKRSILALQQAMENDKKVFLVTQTSLVTENPTKNDIYKIGTIAEINQIIKNSDESIKVLIEIKDRAKVSRVYESDNFLEADVEIFELSNFEMTEYDEALLKSVKGLFEEYYNFINKIPEEILFHVLDSEDPLFIAEYIASNTSIHIYDKQRILESTNVVEKLEILASALNSELNLIAIEETILEKLQSKIDKNHKEYYLREQMKVISEELGEKSPADEKATYESEIKKLKLNNKEAKNTLLKEVEKMSKMSAGSQEASVLRTYLDVCIGLPWNKASKDEINISKSQELLDEKHYGLSKVKERIIEFLSVKKYKPDIKGQVLCLCGPPGIGKTSVARSIADAMGRKYVRISLGGIRDESDIRGHKRTYIGSMPGKIINAIRLSSTNNPLILLDEIDKMLHDFKGDPASALLEVLDSEQNCKFVDHYLDIPFDLSNVIFVATANDKFAIPPALLDRMEVIELTSYTRNEKLNIAKKHILPKQINMHGLATSDINIADDIIYDIIDYYTYEAGVRSLERNLAKICRRIVKAKIQVKEEEKDPKDKIIVSKENISDYLGPRKYKPGATLDNDEVGVVTGLAWTNVGGDVMHIEVSVLDGSGKLELTGSLGDVMKESAKAAISYVRSKSEDFGIDRDFYRNKDIHIHVPEGAVPKDGPSAGVTICTALVSELTKIPVKKDVAMTGEITLRGRLLTIGGIKEKTMAAYKRGIKTVFIPKDNEQDLYEVDPVVKEALEFIPVDKMESVLKGALTAPVKKLNKANPMGFNLTN